MIRVPELIERKRDGGELSADELAELMLGYAQGDIPDYQLAAFAMAVFFRGLTSAETYALTDALIRTGETVDILLDVTNPGLWMAHCHIAEHHESGMMFSFKVTP